MVDAEKSNRAKNQIERKCAQKVNGRTEIINFGAI